VAEALGQEARRSQLNVTILEFYRICWAIEFEMRDLRRIDGS
jgi:hypothetical protein